MRDLPEHVQKRFRAERLANNSTAPAGKRLQHSVLTVGHHYLNTPDFDLTCLVIDHDFIVIAGRNLPGKAAKASVSLAACAIFNVPWSLAVHSYSSQCGHSRNRSAYGCWRISQESRGLHHHRAEGWKGCGCDCVDMWRTARIVLQTLQPDRITPGQHTRTSSLIHARQHPQLAVRPVLQKIRR